MSANREYKSSVFTTLFGDVEKLISLYNALSGSDFPSDTPIIIATLEDVLYNDRYNDIAFVLDDKIVVLIEHQSTISENMPLRLLIYIARVYEKLIDNDSVYRRTLIRIPKPDFIVLYNGVEPFPDEKVLRLSDAYTDAAENLTTLGGALELEVRVVNINEGRNGGMVKKCETLNGYVSFVGKVRANQKAGMELSAAVTQAVKDCIKEGILADFLESHSSEVNNMLITEWNADRARQIWEQEAREKGLAEGKAEGRAEGKAEGKAEVTRIIKLFVQKKQPNEISKELNIPLKNVTSVLREAGLLEPAQ